MSSSSRILIQNILLSTILFVFILGGLGIKGTWFNWLEASLISLSLIVNIYFKKIIVLPPHFKSYMVFLSVFLISLFWSFDTLVSLNYFFLFLSGGLFWLFFFNSEEKSTTLLINKLVVVLGCIYGLIFLLTKILGLVSIESFSLISYSSIHLNHHHIGDLWSVVLLVILFNIVKEKGRNSVLWVIAALGVYFLAVSLSRSAYIAFGVGLIYFINSKKLYGYNVVIARLFILIIAVMFFVVGSEKGLLTSRFYYFLQVVVGLVKNPLGVGVGNFGVISSDFVLKDPINAVFQLRSFSFVTHNILLEFLVGMGIFGLVFVYWFFKIIYQVVKDKSEVSLLARLIFITLTVNFFFDYTYFIPTMLWLLFISLGVAQASIQKIKTSQ